MLFEKEYLVFLVVMITGSVFKEVSSLSCYECTESEAKSCGSQFDKSIVSVINCESSIYTVDANATSNRSYACLLIKEIDTVLKNSTYTRRCSIKNSEDTCENIIARNANLQTIRTNCVQCEKDLCNSSSDLNRNFIVILLVSFVILRM